MGKEDDMEATTEGRDGHLDLLRLDAVRTGEGTPAEAEHLAACQRCRTEFEAIEAAARDLKEIAAFPATDVPPAVDHAVMDAYRRRTARRPFLAYAPARAWKAAAGMAAAAALALSLSLPLLREPPRAPQPVAEPAREYAPDVTTDAPEPVALRPEGDLNADGRTDILDAFLLARSLSGAGRAGVAWDGNGDGRTDAADVDALARRAVAL